MDLKHAAGRNWSRAPRKRHHVHLADGERNPATAPPSPVWYTMEDYRDAPGRNWTRELRRPTSARRRPNADPAKGKYPARERGGGDHDAPYCSPTTSARCPFPFSTREYARLLLLRARVRDGGLAPE